MNFYGDLPMINFEIRFDTVDEMDSFIKRIVPSTIYDNVERPQQQDLEHKPKHLDTGWIDLSLINGAKAYNESLKPQYRKIGNQVFLRGVVDHIAGPNMIFAQLPEGFRPTSQLCFVVSANLTLNLGIITALNCQINTDGTINTATNSLMYCDTGYYLYLDISFLVD